MLVKPFVLGNPTHSQKSANEGVTVRLQMRDLKTPSQQLADTLRKCRRPVQARWGGRDARGSGASWDGQKGVNFASLGQAEANDFSTIIDGKGGQQIERRVRLDERVEVAHHAVVPQHGAGEPGGYIA